MKSAGFSLVEVALALAVVAFALVSLYGLLPLSLNTAKNSSEENAAANLALALETDLRAAGKAFERSPMYGLALNQSSTIYIDAGGGPFPAPSEPGENSRYRVSLKVLRPDAGSLLATEGQLTIHWPARADSDAAAGELSVFVALDRNGP